MDMNYCMQCGTRLIIREHRDEGPTPYCEECKEYRYPVFNTAVSMIVTNRKRDALLLIRQYSRPFYILTAGYVNKGEDAENAARREIQEELGMTVEELHFNRSHYFAPSNTLMLNFTATVAEDAAHPNWEVDDWHWFSVLEALQQVKPNSLAEAFLKGYLTGQYCFPF